MSNLVKSAAMVPVVELADQSKTPCFCSKIGVDEYLANKRGEDELIVNPEYHLYPCGKGPAPDGFMKPSWGRKSNGLIGVPEGLRQCILPRNVTRADLLKALQDTKATVDQSTLASFEEYKEQFGTG